MLAGISGTVVSGLSGCQGWGNDSNAESFSTGLSLSNSRAEPAAVSIDVENRSTGSKIHEEVELDVPADERLTVGFDAEFDEPGGTATMIVTLTDLDTEVTVDERGVFGGGTGALFFTARLRERRDEPTLGVAVE